MEIKEKVLLKDHTTLKVGGSAEYYVECGTKDELTEAVQYAKGKDLSVTVLGGGSNVLIPDSGLSGLVIKNNLVGREVSETDSDIFLGVASGEDLDDVVSFSVISGWWGLENLSHIPGSVGAVPIQNVGAYGVEAKDIVSEVEVLDTKTLETFSLSNGECKFSYRNSIFKTKKNLIITKVIFKLSKLSSPKITYKDLEERFSNEEPTLEKIRQTVIEIRVSKFPDWHEVGTAGSFFKNPIIDETKLEELQHKYPSIPSYNTDEGIKVPLGFILDKVLNLKGYKKGNVGLYDKQALVLINLGTTASEVDLFAREIEEKIFNEVGIKVEREVTILN